MTCYLDYNASAPLLKEAKEASVIALDLVGNPSSVHKKGRASRYFIEKARKKVASLVGMEADNIIFTSGATEANNIALLNSKVFTSAIEHESVTEQLEISYIKTDKLGYMCLDDLNFKNISWGIMLPMAELEDMAAKEATKRFEELAQ